MSQPDPPERKTGFRWSALAGAFFTLGILILLPSGLCTAVMLPSVFSSDPDALNAVLYVGMVAAVGAALVYVGIRLTERE